MNHPLDRIFSWVLQFWIQWWWNVTSAVENKTPKTQGYLYGRPNYRILTETNASGSWIRIFIRLEQNPNDKDLISKFSAWCNTIKGTCGFWDSLVWNRCPPCRKCNGRFRDGDLEVTAAYVSLILESLDRVRFLLGHIEAKWHRTGRKWQTLTTRPWCCFEVAETNSRPGTTRLNQHSAPGPTEEVDLEALQFWRPSKQNRQNQKLCRDQNRDSTDQSRRRNSSPPPNNRHNKRNIRLSPISHAASMMDRSGKSDDHGLGIRFLTRDRFTTKFPLRRQRKQFCQPFATPQPCWSDYKEA